MRLFRTFLWLGFFSLILPAQISSQSANLPLNHWAYKFLDRLEVKGLYDSRDFNTRPYTRQAIAEIIQQVSRQAAADLTLLSQSEWGLFDQLKGEFYEELGEVDPQISVKQNERERHALSFREDDFQLHLDALFGQQFRLESKEKVDLGVPKSVTSWGFSFRVNIKGSMAIYSEAQAFVLTGVDSLINTVFNPSLGLPVTRKALIDVTTTDNASAYVAFGLPWFDLEIGRDLVEWGPGYRGNLILSRNSNFYDLFKTTFRYSGFKFEYLHSFLNSDRSKYLAGHRLEIRPVKSFRMAVSETVVYGGRSVELFYANPFVPIIISERHVGNKDNNLVSFDFTWFWYRQKIKLYTEILFDDFNFAKNIFRNWVNKWGVMLGGYWVDPLGLKNTDFRFELTRIQPFVYSHKQEINTYSNYNNSLGQWLGPDADEWNYEIRNQLHRNLNLGITWERRRKGQNDITQGKRPPNNEFKFLDGVVEKNYFYGLTAQWQISRDLFLTTTYHYIHSENLKREEGVNQNNHRLLINLSLNY